MRVAISVSIGLAIGALGLPAQARQAPPAARTVLADLRQETGDTSTRLVIVGSAKSGVTHHAPDPLTLVVEIADADSSRLPARLEVATREIESLRVSSLARGDGRSTARIEVRLAALSPFTVEENGNDVVITVSRPNPVTQAQVEKVVEPAVTVPSRNLAPEKASGHPSLAESAPRATRISGVTKLAGGQAGYHVEGNGTLRPESFFLKNPNRLVVDFPDVLAGRGSSLPAPVAPVKSMRLAQFSAAAPRVARLVLEVDSSTPYQLVPDATGVAIVFGKGVKPSPALLGAPARMVEPARATADAATFEVTPIVQPELPPVQIPAPSPAATPSVTKEFATEAPPVPKPAPAKPPAAKPAPAKPMVVAEPIATPPPPQDLSRSATCGEPPFIGHSISLDFKEGDLIDLFRLIAEISGLNVIVNPGISGKASLTVREVPWDQALVLILKAQKLGCSFDGNVVRIATLADLQAEEIAIRSLKKEKELSGEQTSWQGRLSYLDTDQVKGVVEKTVLSDKGTFISVGAGNVFIVTDLPDRVEAAKKLVLEIDRPSAQVEIEARVVVTSRSFSRQLGVQWGFLNQQTPQYGNTTNLAFPNSIVLNGQGVPSTGGIGADQGGLATNAGIGAGPRGYLVNLPAADVNTGIGISMGNILGSFNLDAALTAAESSGRARIISTPRITTQNKVAAEIKSGVQIPYQTVTNGTVNVSYKDAGLSMKVTPTITDAGTVLMQVIVDNSSPDFGRSTLAGVPINIQNASTTVLVKDGATTVIGGIYQGQETLTRQNTPFLSQIPLLGLLFKNQGTQNTNNELLIFITPRIVR